MKSYPLIDLHQDLLLAESDRTHGTREQSNIEMLMQSQIKLVLGTGFADPDDASVPANEWITKDLETYQALVDKDSRWRLVRSLEDIDAVLASKNEKGILFHIEGANGILSEKDLPVLDVWYDRGLRSIGLVWIISNALGGGTHDPDKGLTELGAKVLAWCEAHQVAIDLAHMNRPTFWDALTRISKPPLVTHTAAAALFETPRNLTDEQLRAVGERGGVAGVFVAKGSLLGKESTQPLTLEVVVAHLQHMKDVVGAESVALGTDYGGIVSGVPTDMKNILELPKLFEALRARGWSEDDLEKLCYKNALRVLTAQLS